MAVTLARRITDRPKWREAARTAHGEVRHRRRRPAVRHDGSAGNKNGALPILASSVLTEDEVIVRNVPRIRDVEAMLQILAAIGVDVSWRGPNEVALCARARSRGRDRARARRADQGVVPARGAAARTLPPRGHAAARRRRDRPPTPRSAPRRVPRDGRRRRVWAGDRANRGRVAFARPTCSMDEPSVMATENALMAAALTPGRP